MTRRTLIAWTTGLAVIAVAVAWPNASAPMGPLSPGDASMLQRLAVIQLGAAVVLWLFHRDLRRAAADWGAVCAPAWAHVSAAPAAFAPLAFVALAWALLRARTTRHLLLIATLSALNLVLGAAGWIFHYFESPLLPSLVAASVSVALWAPASLLATRCMQRGVAWLPLAACCWPATEWIRGEWLTPPLPGLFLSHAAAGGWLLRLAPGAGEYGLSFLLSAFAFAGATLLVRAPERPRMALGAGALAATTVVAAAVLAGGAASGDEASGATTRICAVQDPNRVDRSRAPFDGGGASAIKALARRAGEQLGCDVTILPEYSLELHADRLVPRDVGRARTAGPVLLGGVFSMTRDAEGRPVDVRNVVCQMHENGGDFLCSDPLDKLVFAPFGEAALFYDSPLLAPLGRWITERATGHRFEGLATLRGNGSVEAGGRHFGAAICWEILVPGIFQRRGIQPDATSLLVVPSDLDGFGGSLEGIEQFRRASRIHALRLRTPLVFASTHGAFLVGSDGEDVPPVRTEPFFAIWDLPLRPR